MIRCVDGAIKLDLPQDGFYPQAEEIYSVVHEGATSIRGVPVASSDFTSLGIHFSTYSGEAFIEFSPSTDSKNPAIRVKVSARDGTKEIPIPVVDGKFADYGCDGSVWLPLAPGTTALIEQTIGSISPSGTITLKQYFNCTGSKSPALTIIDHVPEALAESRAYPAPEISMPKAFSGTLYPYQATGFRWLAYMAGQGVPGCFLADEMGLGKTVQVICSFLACKESGMTKPALIVAPATLLENWRREFLKFAPSVVPVVHRGANRAGISAHLKKHEVVVTSYETLVSDISLFRSIEWGLMVLDEAQAIKNPSARRTQEIKTLVRDAGIAVTGTPVENRLTDLWSISDFLLPGRLGTLADFQRHFPETRDGATSLEPRVSPFILRRRVAEVATDLPPRIDIPQAIELDDRSVDAYESIRLTADPNVKGSALAVLQKLRLFCAHPWLSDQMRSIIDPAACSNKLVRLFQILEEVFENGQKVLIFTSFHEMSDMIKASVDSKFKVPAWQIDGRTPVPDRQQLVDKFSQVNGAAALVLNPRAAGTGLNIVAANHVIHFNLEWNPAVEDQASARSFRRGQTLPVTVHRLFYSGTVEEFISMRAMMKRELAENSVIGSDGSDLDAGEIVRALNITPLGGL
jgi:SNF2 family DNA or RNA helicase